MTSEQADRLIAVLVAAYPVPAWPEETVILFATDIEDLDYDACSVAMRTWRMTRRDRPTIFDIRDATRRQLDAAGQRPHEVDGDEAWGYVVEQRSVTGRYRPFPADRYPEVARVVARMGWETLCDSDNPEADRAHFLRLFELEKGRVREARNAAPALALEDDRERLAAQGSPLALPGRPEVLSLPVPDPGERASFAASLRDLIASLEVPGAPTAAAVSAAAVAEDREPTSAEQQRREERRGKLLREQMAILGPPARKSAA